MKNRTKKLLEERGSRYGDFDDLAKISQDLKDRWYLEQNGNFKEPTEAMNEAMEMVLHKLARVMNGDRYYLDSIDDMIGYLELYRQEIIKNSTNNQDKEKDHLDTKTEQLNNISENNREVLSKIIESITGEKIDLEKDIKEFTNEEEFIDYLVEEVYKDYIKQQKEEIEISKSLLDELAKEFNFK